MKLIAGLGNPGSEYIHTRHNIGFEVVEKLAEEHRIPMNRSKFNALYGKGTIHGEEVLLVKPLTYMNLSGEAIGPMMSYFKIPIEDILIIYDDLDLAVGKLRLRLKGSAGGHNGMKSIIQHVGSTEFKRLRFGIGRPPGRQPVVDYVLKKFSKEEDPVVESVVEKAVKACEEWFKDPFDKVMNKYNA
ncbi:PTH1 family peptidyl-tRNA hydrolase [Pullulanibacillus pueri]|uniref:Peptidyl-tRNA hydrolase n=1 Tax=Pullulanibacillus pueri TaxID=1437324 RepID=A0A8J2ZZ72_9BACL|nr:aminoacyl-tRNA hydrolase [Pullulanibacillus pueri]MBM7683939.1 PTH1 family peptidyl-tRNA hydrolase [Pullulanibacillus pueri]GGH88022.1 peptidyl-tRNA hydrolase [Pullulanibacillus pueri]